MMGKRFEPMKKNVEFDAFTGWRYLLHWKSGDRKKIKRGYNKRVRKLFRLENRQIELT